jgi:hypothetical protein
MIALVHYADSYSPPLGIWWEGDDGLIGHYYFDGDSEAARRGTVTVMQRPADSATPIPEWFCMLADRAPYFITWEIVEYEGDPELVLRQLDTEAKRLLGAA